MLYHWILFAKSFNKFKYTFRKIYEIRYLIFAEDYYKSNKKIPNVYHKEKFRTIHDISREMCNSALKCIYQFFSN